MPDLSVDIRVAAIRAATAVLQLPPGNDGAAIESLLDCLDAGPHPTREGARRWYLPTGRASMQRESVVMRWLAEAGSGGVKRHPDRVRHGNAGNQAAAKGDDARSAKVTFRVTARTKSRWVKAAQRAGVNLSEYVSQLCDAEAERLGVK